MAVSSFGIISRAVFREQVSGRDWLGCRSAERQVPCRLHYFECKTGSAATSKRASRHHDTGAVPGFGIRIASGVGMKPIKSCVPILTLLLGVGIAGCSSAPTKSPDVSSAIKRSLSDAGLKDVSVSQDRDKGVVTLGGHVPGDKEKSLAESVATSLAQGQVVANEIAIVTPGVESQSKDINADVDKGIEKNLDAALIQNGLQKAVSFKVKNGVITLTGEVTSERARTQAAQIAGSVPYQQQVVNELQVKNQKATSY
jgi:hyperosmotically inducible protein